MSNHDRARVGNDSTTCETKPAYRVLAVVAKKKPKPVPAKKPKLGNLEVTVRGESGRVINGVTVSISGGTAKPPQVTKNGKTLFTDLVPGPYTATATLARLEPVSDSTDVPAGHTAKLVLRLKSVVTARIVAVTFRSDHLASGGQKLIKVTVDKAVNVATLSWNAATGQVDTTVSSLTSHYDDAHKEYLKPEWDEARRGSADSHPISQTMGTKIKLDADIRFTVSPPGEIASLQKLEGAGGADYVAFERALAVTVSNGQKVTVKGVEAKKELPRQVDDLTQNIAWEATVSGKKVNLGTTGEHRIYVTYGRPGGRLQYGAGFQERGAQQIVTDYRLWRAVTDAQGKGAGGEKECVDAVFQALYDRRVGYVLGRRWKNDKNETGVTPKPSLHHYLWLCASADGQGECHNIAAAFQLECRILGVTGTFQVGYMFPWASRVDTGTYDKSGAKSPAGYNVLGKFKTNFAKRYTRVHAEPGHGNEALVFLDGTGRANNFEGVTAYNSSALYAIGDAVFDLFPAADDNASSYYAQRHWNGIHPVVDDWDQGLFDLVFSSTQGKGWCNKPYPWKSSAKFRWEE